ncbi:MAG TPA: FAD-dependent oxidoreductase [Deltaproteobacteria bacterium]|nr:FAD-dependent oxidoreductase [Deltaproteobacteria bacterium]HRR20706.1 FAD-dependent oxidoreductase [Desulfomonilia bacterium]HOE71645.1 FAD-dependent oxidoreductase [Deltaproteobacteria bacterium]HON62589.1 FAD-dependent oxidoreductase [Deltaproteobacteria bacterium]HOS27951.1 FAD-dependent oxidoreductase [Deltaproteobacteria bacterium]
MSEHHTTLTEPVRDLPGRPVTLWLDTTPETDYPALDRDLKVDTLVVGGGIAGLTTALMLQQAGMTTAVIDFRRIVSGVTGHTTAKITSLHGIVYRTLITHFGREGAGIYAEANQTAIEKTAALVEKEGIDCEFSRASAYTYAVTDSQARRIEEEVKAAESIGLPVFYVQETSLPFPTRGAVCLRDQAKFHPRKYLLALAVKYTGEGGLIFENTRALGVRRNGAGSEVMTDHGPIRARHVVVTTNFPFFDPAFFFTRMYQKRSYVLALRVNYPLPEGMYISIEEPFHSIRSHPMEGGDILLVGGQMHKTGHARNTAELYKSLESFARDRFAVSSIDYRWSTQDNVTTDLVPYIGVPTPMHKNIYIATGFAGWGMTHGMIAAMIITDDILGRRNDWSALYNPFRFKPSSAYSFFEQNLHVAKTFVRERIVSSPEKLQGRLIAPGQGGVFSLDHDKAGVARDRDGVLHAVSPVCTHMGCMVTWNNAEESWDCPCHGSRFDSDGKVIHAPAKKDLEKKSLKDTPSE